MNEILFKKVFNNKFLRSLIFNKVKQHVNYGYKYQEIQLLSWICQNHYFGLALDKLKYNRDQLSERFGISNLYELLIEMDRLSASELLKYLLTDYDFNITSNQDNNEDGKSINELIVEKRIQFFTCLPILDYITKTCTVQDIINIENSIPAEELTKITSTTALDNAPFIENVDNRNKVVKYLIENRNEGCSFKILVNTITSNDLPLLKYLLENVNQFKRGHSENYYPTLEAETINQNQALILKQCISNLNIPMLEYILEEFTRFGFTFDGRDVNWFQMIAYSLENVSKGEETLIYFGDTKNKDQVFEIIKYIVDNRINDQDRKSLENKLLYKVIIMNSFLFSLMNSLVEICDYFINQSKLISLPLDKDTLVNCSKHQYFYSISYRSLVFCHENNIKISDYSPSTTIKLSLENLESLKYVEQHGISNEFSFSCTDLESVKLLNGGGDDGGKEMDIDGILIECAVNGNLETMAYLSDFVPRELFNDELVVAALNGSHLNVIRFLFGIGVEINLDYLLMVAGSLNNSDVVMMIFKEFKFDPSNITLDILEATCKKGCLEMLNYLYSICPTKPMVIKQSTIDTLNRCIKSKCWDIVNWLLDNLFPTNHGSLQDTKLRIVKGCGISYLPIVMKLVKHNFTFSNLNLCYENVKVLEYLHDVFGGVDKLNGFTSEAIDNASKYDCYNSVKYLLDTRKEGYRKAITYSLTRGWFDIIELLSLPKYSYQYKPTVIEKPPIYYDIVDQVIQLGSPQMLSFIFNQNPFTKLPITGKQITNAITKSGHLSMLSMLLDHLNNDPSILDQCLNISIQFDKPQIIKYLKNKLNK